MNEAADPESGGGRQAIKKTKQILIESAKEDINYLACQSSILSSLSPHPPQPVTAGHVRVYCFVFFIAAYTEDTAQRGTAVLTVNLLSPLCQHRKRGFISVSLVYFVVEGLGEKVIAEREKRPVTV